MANLTAKYAKWVHGKNPQFLIEEVTRWRIYETRYWMEECFALSAAELAGKAMELKYVAGTVAPNTRPTPFLCLVAKMLQIQPDMSIVLTFIQNEEFKYMRCLGMYYFRLVADQADIYKTLEPFYTDFRKIKHQEADGSFHLMHIDEFVDKLLHEERFLSMQLPRLSKRRIFEAQDLLEPRISPLEGEFQEMLENEDKYGKAGTSTSMEDTDSDLENKYCLKPLDLPKAKIKTKKKSKKSKSKVSEFFEENSEEEYFQRKARAKNMGEHVLEPVKGDQDDQDANFNLGKMLKNFKKDKKKIYEKAAELEMEDIKNEEKRLKVDKYYGQAENNSEKAPASRKRRGGDIDDHDDHDDDKGQTSSSSDDNAVDARRRNRDSHNHDKKIVDQRRKRKLEKQQKRDRELRKEIYQQSKQDWIENKDRLVRKEAEEEKEFAMKKEAQVKHHEEKKRKKREKREAEKEERKLEKQAAWEKKQEDRYGKKKFTHNVDMMDERQRLGGR